MRRDSRQSRWPVDGLTKRTRCLPSVLTTAGSSSPSPTAWVAMRAGEVASSLALETIVEAVADGQSLDDAFVLANERVHVKSDGAREAGHGHNDGGGARRRRRVRHCERGRQPKLPVDRRAGFGA